MPAYFEGDSVHYRSYFGMIRLSTVRPPGETVVNRSHGASTVGVPVVTYVRLYSWTTL